MRSVIGRSAAAAAILVLASGVLARSLSAVTVPTVAFSDTRLANGLRVVIAEDHSAPLFAIAVVYGTGSRDERRGRTGFAHLFEHMMFKGSANVGTGEHFLLVFNNGGDMNGTTDKERTLYYERLPSNQLDLALFLEADRMRSLDITRENLDNQRKAVQEERRLGVDNQPYGRTFETVDELAYENFAYEHPVIGSMADLEAATVDDVGAFFKTYYAPNNAVLSIVGDVDTKACLAKVRKYFESIPAQAAPPRIDLTEPAQDAERRQTLDDALARLPRIDIAFHAPAANTPEHDALSVLTSVLAGGRSSRLFEQVVRQKQLAVNVNAFLDGNHGPDLLRIIGIAAPGRPVAELEEAIHAEVERLKTGGAEPWELDKARNGGLRGFVNGLGSSLQRAILLAEYALFYDNPGLINTRYQQIASVTAEDVSRVAAKYLTPATRTVVITSPAAKSQGGDR